MARNLLALVVMVMYVWQKSNAVRPTATQLKTHGRRFLQSARVLANDDCNNGNRCEPPKLLRGLTAEAVE